LANLSRQRRLWVVIPCMERAAGNRGIGRGGEANEGKKPSQRRIVEFSLQPIEVIGAETDARAYPGRYRNSVLNPDIGLLIPVKQLGCDEWEGRPDWEDSVFPMCVVFKK